LTLANGSTLATSGAFSQTLTATATTAVTLPTSGTIMSSVTALSGAVTGTPSSTTYLRGDATWATVSGGGGTPGGSNTQVQYNSSGSFAGSANFVFDGTNVGIGTSPSAWGSGTSVIDLNTGGLAGALSSSGTLSIASNGYFNGTNWIYKNSSYAQLYQMISGKHSWQIAPIGTAGNAITFTQAMTLDTSGNLGIGTTSPNYKLQLNSGASSSTYLQITHADAGTGASDGLLIGLGVGSSPNANIIQYENAPMLFFTNGTEAMRIDASQNLLVGTTSALTGGSGKIQVLGAATSNAMNMQVGTNGYPAINFNNASSSQQGYIQVNSSTVLYVSVSDYRLKQNILPMTGALAKVALLKPVTYKWKLDGSNGQGFIAHELAEVCPEAVTGGKDAVDKDGNPKYQGIDTSFLVATLTAAIQEQQTLIESLTARLTALENK